MKQIKMFKNQICVLLILCIALTSCMIQSGWDASNTAMTRSEQVLDGKEDSQQIETVKALPTREDYRLEDASYNALAFALQKLNLSGNRKIDLATHFDAVCVVMDQPFWRCANRLQKQYCYRADSIIDCHRVLISYLHRKDGEKESSIF